jgi:hypothetical protein
MQSIWVALHPYCIGPYVYFKVLKLIDSFHKSEPLAEIQGLQKRAQDLKALKKLRSRCFMDIAK